MKNTGHEKDIISENSGKISEIAGKISKLAEKLANSRAKIIVIIRGVKLSTFIETPPKVKTITILGSILTHS